MESLSEWCIKLVTYNMFQFSFARSIIGEWAQFTFPEIPHSTKLSEDTCVKNVTKMPGSNEPDWQMFNLQLM